MYGSHQHCVLCTLSLLLFLVASLCCVTLDGEIVAATLACCEERAAWTAGGTAPPGTERPSDHKTRIASRPEREKGFPEGLDGVGVVDRGVISWIPRLLPLLAPCFDLLFPIFQEDIVV